MSEKLPRRRVTCEIRIGADDFETLIHAVKEILGDLHEGMSGTYVTGGSTSGYSVTVDEDPSITHDSYFDALEKLKETRKCSAT